MDLAYLLRYLFSSSEPKAIFCAYTARFVSGLFGNLIVGFLTRWHKCVDPILLKLADFVFTVLECFGFYLHYFPVCLLQKMAVYVGDPSLYYG